MAGTLVLAIVASCATRLGRQGEEGGVELEGAVNRKGPLDRRLWERSSSYHSPSALNPARASFGQKQRDQKAKEFMLPTQINVPGHSAE